MRIGVHTLSVGPERAHDGKGDPECNKYAALVDKEVRDHWGAGLINAPGCHSVIAWHQGIGRVHENHDHTPVSVCVPDHALSTHTHPILQSTLRYVFAHQSISFSLQRWRMRLATNALRAKSNDERLFFMKLSRDAVQSATE